jgi:tripartite ATP-independent transporter DctP family solute receptor
VLKFHGQENPGQCLLPVRLHLDVWRAIGVSSFKHIPINTRKSEKMEEMMKKYSMLNIAFGAITSTLIGITANASEVTLRLGTAVHKTHPAYDAAQRFSDGVRQRTNGAVDVQIFPARQLGDIKELVEGARFGTIDLSITTSSAVADLAPGVDALQLPWLIESYSHFAKLVDTPEAKALTSPLEKNGFICLAIYEGGEHHFLSNRTIRTIDDFKGLKTRVFPVRMHLDTWRAISVNPTPMAYGEVYSALETHTLDAVDINVSSIFAEKYYEVAKKVTLTGHFFWPEVLLMNKKRLEGLKLEYQTAIRKSATEAMEPQIMAAESAEARDRAALAKMGVSFDEVSAELKADMQRAVEPIYKTYMAKDPGIGAFVARAKSLQNRSKASQ